MIDDPIRSALDAGKTLSNVWIMLGSSLSLEIAAHAGWDTVTIDLQHGHGGFSHMVAMITAADAAKTPALVRIPHNEPGYIHRALDAGAQGVIAPMINTGNDAQDFASACKYPPVGGRSWGPVRAALITDGDYTTEANDWTFCCVQIETQAALDNIDDIMSVDGIDCVLVGPNDLCLSLTKGKKLDINAPEVLDALDLILAKAKEHNVYAWCFANDAEYARMVAKKGYQIITAGADVGFVAAGAEASLKAAFDR